MIKTLAQHGNSYALLFDRTLMELLRMTPSTPLELTVEGDVLRIKPLIQEQRFQPNTALIRERRILHTNVFRQMTASIAAKTVEEEARVRQLIREAVYSDPAPLILFEKGLVFEQVLDEIFGYGPLGPVLRDPTIGDFAIESDRRVTAGGRTLPVEFDSDEHVRQVVLLFQGKRRTVGKYVEFDSGSCKIRVAKQWAPKQAASRRKKK